MKTRVKGALAQAEGHVAPLVAERNFLRATRDTGYRSTSAALSELIDNALQAGAGNVAVFVLEAVMDRHRDVTLAVLDDGTGMDPRSLQRAIQFGGSTRFDDRSGFGRYGMGLPNSSVSQARRLEVTSWKRRGVQYQCHLDLDEVLSSSQRGVAPPKRVSLPAWAAEHAGSQGTLVTWSRCDRLTHKKASTLIEKLAPVLGRTYRRALWGGLSLQLNGKAIRPVDPMFSHPLTNTGGGIPYGPPLRYRIRIPGNSAETAVEVRFVELPVATWHSLSVEEKHLRGIVGGAGVSVLRAGREVDFGWHFMGGKRRENYDDWWRCEVCFSPPADELFGVTHNKQGIAPTIELRQILSPDLEAIARFLNRRVRDAFDACRAERESPAAVAATVQDEYLPSLRGPVGPHASESHYEYRIRRSTLPTTSLFSASRRGSRINVRLNSDHPFVQAVYRASGKRHDESRIAVEKLVLAAARARLSCATADERVAVDRYIDEWSEVLAAFSSR